MENSKSSKTTRTILGAMFGLVAGLGIGFICIVFGFFLTMTFIFAIIGIPLMMAGVGVVILGPVMGILVAHGKMKLGKSN